MNKLNYNTLKETLNAEDTQYLVINHPKTGEPIKIKISTFIDIFGGDLVIGADNGLTVVGNNTELGGALTKNTTIDLNSFDYILDNVTAGSTDDDVIVSESGTGKIKKISASSFVSAVPMYRYSKTLTQANVAAINAGTLNITPADLGLTATQAAKIHTLSTEWWIVPDGAAWTGTGQLVLKTTTGGTGVTNISVGEFAGVGTNLTLQTNTLSGALGSASVIRITANDSFYLVSNAADLAGGGANATITMVLYYEKIDF